MSMWKFTFMHGPTFCNTRELQEAREAAAEARRQRDNQVTELLV